MVSQRSLLRVGVVNPTTLNNAAWKFSKLSFDLTLVSETSATKAMHHTYAKAFHDFGFRILWGPPVPASRVCVSGADSLKGRALGVCLVASKPIAVRPSRDALPDSWDATCRIMVSYAQLSSFTARVITVYGVPACSPQAAHKNLTLWTAILGLLQESDVPTIVGGDFNVRPDTLEVWDSISALGFVEAFRQHEAVTGILLPPTCRSATRNDTLVYSWHFARCFRSASVNTDGLFPDHDPLCVNFDIQVGNFVYRSLRLPSALLDGVLRSELFQVEQAKLAATCDRPATDCVEGELHTSPQNLGKCLSRIGSAFETAYDRTVQSLNEYMGSGCSFPVRQPERTPRLHPRLPQPVAPRQSPRRARHGSFEPPYEVFRMKSIQWTKQMRRLEAFRHRVRKYHGSAMSDSVGKQHLAEWNAILTSTGFKPSFPKWALAKGLCPIWLPFAALTLDWISDLCTAFRAALNELAWRENHVRGKLFRHQVDLNLLHYGGGLSHGMIKPPKPLAPGHFELPVQFNASLMRCDGKQKPVLRITSEQLPDPALPCHYDGGVFRLQPSAQKGCFTVADVPRKCPNHFTFDQRSLCVDPDRVAAAFFEFWAPYWLRDQGPLLNDISEWSGFLELASAVPDLHLPGLDFPHTVD